MQMELVDSVAPPAPEPSPAPAPEPAPSPAPTPEPAPEVPPTTEPAPEAPPVEPPASSLFRLPDGRQVDAQGLLKEYENLLPEFTRRSQELAALRTQKQPLNNEQPIWKNPDFQPASWGDAIEIAKAEAIKEMTQSAEAAQAEEAAVRAGVEQQIASIKAVDPKVDENALFEHAVKYGFNDLNGAYSNFKAMRDAVVQTEQRVTKNLTARAADPIATTPTPPPVAKVDQPISRNLQNYRGALDFLAAIKAKS